MRATPSLPHPYRYMLEHLFTVVEMLLFLRIIEQLNNRH